MLNITSPVFENVTSPVVAIYLEKCMQNYINYINDRFSFDDLACGFNNFKNWIYDLFVDNDNEIKGFLDKYLVESNGDVDNDNEIGDFSDKYLVKSKADVENIIVATLKYFGDLLFGDIITSDQYTNSPISIWNLNSLKNSPQVIKLFGQNSPVVVDVVVGPTTFTHEMNEVFTLGLFQIINNNREIVLYIYGQQLSTSDFSSFYDQSDYYRYKLNLNNNSLYFKNNDVFTEYVRGIITGCSWINKNTNDIIKTIEKNNDGDITNLYLDGAIIQ